MLAAASKNFTGVGGVLPPGTLTGYVIELTGLTHVPLAQALATDAIDDALVASLRGVVPPVVNWVEVIVRFQPGLSPYYAMRDRRFVTACARVLAIHPYRATAKEEAPMRPWYRRSLILIAVVLTAGSALAGQGTAKASSSPIRYVALGDSYSAASGVLPPDPTAPPECLRSLLNYPHLIAGQTGAQLTDVTCGGAKTSDYFSSQYTGVAPQLDALQTNTQLVTMTIGGNDSNLFVNVIVDCGEAGLSTLGQGHPCEDRYGSSFDDTINTTTYPALVKALQAVHAKAPHAKVAILGYPWILPPSVGCFDKIPVAAGDVPYVDNIQATLNDAVSRAAAATETTYVDMSAVSEGHDACEPIGVRWIEPVLQGTNPVILHPNALGEAHMASETITVLGLG